MDNSLSLVYSATSNCGKNVCTSCLLEDLLQLAYHLQFLRENFLKILYSCFHFIKCYIHGEKYVFIYIYAFPQCHYQANFLMKSLQLTYSHDCKYFQQVVSICKNSVLLWDFCDLFDSVLRPCRDSHSSCHLQSEAEVEVPQ